MGLMLAPWDTVAELAQEADQVICPSQPGRFQALGCYSPKLSPVRRRGGDGHVARSCTTTRRPASRRSKQVREASRRVDLRRATRVRSSYPALMRIKADILVRRNARCSTRASTNVRTDLFRP